MNDLPAYFEVSKPSRASLVRHSLYNLNRIGNRQHTCLTRFPIFILLVSPRFSRKLTPGAIYKLLFKHLSRQSISVFFRICFNLVQLTRSNAFRESLKQTLSSSYISKVRSDIIVIIPTASPVPFPLLNPKVIFAEYNLNSLFNPSSKYFCYYLCCMCDNADCVMVAAFCSLWLLL